MYGYDISTAMIPIHRLPAVLIEVCLDRDIDPNRLLRGTGIFMEDVSRGARRLTPGQCFRLIDNARRLAPAELPFLAGHRLFPGHYGAAGTAWTNAANLLEALRLLEQFSHYLSPLWTPRLSLDGDGATVYWSDACGGEAHADFFNALMMTAVSSFCRWLGERSFQWHYALPGPLGCPEQFAVHLGPNVRPGTHTAFMRIDRDSLLSPWPKASASAATAARQQAMREGDAMPVGFIASVDRFLRDQIAHAPGLDQLADAFDMSPATLKRNFKKHNTHFQARYDRVRQYLAVEWLTRRGLSLEEVARRLHFHDGRNLRRAFKRWTGIPPSALIARGYGEV